MGLGTTPANLALASALLGVLALAGLGPTACAAPARMMRYGIALSPLVGTVLVSSIGVLRFDLLHVPLRGPTTVTALVAVSLTLALAARRKLRLALRTLRPGDVGLLLLPLLSLAAGAWTFGRDGFHVLQGGQDEIQYCATARHMMTEMHTGSPNDTPARRQAHFVCDAHTRHGAYTTLTRHSAEVLLATLAQTLGRPPEETFPILVEAAGVSLAGRSHFWCASCWPGAG